MENRFESKKDTWLILVMVAALVVALVATIPAVVSGMWWAILPMIAVFGFVYWIFNSTYYVVEAHNISVRSGPFKWTVPVDEIESIEPTNNPLSSPALSLDRLKIRYSGGRWIMISPADKEGFIAAVERARNRN